MTWSVRYFFLTGTFERQFLGSQYRSMGCYCILPAAIVAVTLHLYHCVASNFMWLVENKDGNFQMGEIVFFLSPDICSEVKPEYPEGGASQLKLNMKSGVFQRTGGAMVSALQSKLWAWIRSTWLHGNLPVVPALCWFPQRRFLAAESELSNPGASPWSHSGNETRSYEVAQEEEPVYKAPDPIFSL